MKTIYFTILLLIITSCVGNNQKDSDNITKLKKINQQLKDKLYLINEGELISQEIFR